MSVFIWSCVNLLTQRWQMWLDCVKVYKTCSCTKVCLFCVYLPNRKWYSSPWIWLVRSKGQMTLKRKRQEEAGMRKDLGQSGLLRNTGRRVISVWPCILQIKSEGFFNTVSILKGVEVWNCSEKQCLSNTICRSLLNFRSPQHSLLSIRSSALASPNF